MYAGTGNLSKTTIIEQLIYISRELDGLVSQLLRYMPEEGGLPSQEVLDKLYRQDVAITKDKIDQAVSRLLEFIASGRMGLIDSKEFYISIAMGLRRITDYVEAVIHRLLLAKKKLGSDLEIPELSNTLREMIRMLEEAIFETSSIIRAFSTISRGNTEILKTMESKVDRIKEIEQDADETYRDLMEKLLDFFPDNYIAYTVYREILDKLEDALDEAERIAIDLKILALTSAY
ncbi:MAG: DUF47 family protein [Desulfurococcales archaeon]|nr:DUF47 family protein [Desulfurococcales archaeon]